MGLVPARQLLTSKVSVMDDAGGVDIQTPGLCDHALENARSNPLVPPFCQIMNSVPDAMIMIDQRGAIVALNQNAEELFGYSEDEVINRNVSMLMTSPDGEVHDDHMERYLDGGSAKVLGRMRRVVGRKRNGTTFPHELTVTELNAGEERLFVGFIRDLEDRERAERQLRMLHDELLHVSRIGAMGMMATALAHELNQPLAAVTSFVQTAAALIRSGATADSVCDALDAAAAEALRSGNIVHRLRDFVARGELERFNEPLSRLVSDATTLAMAGAHELGVECEVDLGPAETIVLVDRIQIQQVLVNLIRNAIDAMGDAGGIIHISARQDQAMVEVTVADTGPGLTPECISRIFEAFVSGKKDGLGIGLSICRMIVEAHGGRIWVRNRPRSGAAFSFTLPLAEDIGT